MIMSKYVEIFEDWKQDSASRDLGDEFGKSIQAKDKKIPEKSKDALGWYASLVKTVKESGNKLKSIFNSLLGKGKGVSDNLGKEIVSDPNSGELKLEEGGYYSGTNAWYWNTIKGQSAGKNLMGNGKAWKITIPRKVEMPKGLDIELDDFKHSDIEGKSPYDFYTKRGTEDPVSDEIDLTTDIDIEESLKYIKTFESNDTRGSTGGYLRSDVDVSCENIGIEGLVDQIVSIIDGQSKGGIYKAPLIWGAPGIGKTEVVLQAGRRLNIPVISIPLANMENVDFLGLPHIKDDKTTFAPPAIFPRENIKTGKTEYTDQFSKKGVVGEEQPNEIGGIIFLDEINRANQSVLGSCLSFISLRTIGTYRLPQNWHIVAACNRDKDVTTSNAITEMDAAVASTGRFRVFNLVPSLPTWISDYARAEGRVWDNEDEDDTNTKKWKIPQEIIDFLEMNEYDNEGLKNIIDSASGKEDLRGEYQYFYRKKEGEVDTAGQGVQPAPRVWSDLGIALSTAMYKGDHRTNTKYKSLVDLYKALPDWVSKTVNGDLGDVAGNAFMKFLNLKSKVDLSLVKKVFDWKKLEKADRDKIIKQLGEKGLSDSTRKGSRISEEGFAFLSAISGYASSKRGQYGIPEFFNYLNFLKNMNDETQAITNFIKTGFPMYNRIEKALDNKINNSNDKEEYKEKKELFINAYHKMIKKLEDKWPASFKNFFDSIKQRKK